MLFDNDGNFAPLAANILIEYGYNCGVLIFGLDNLTAYTPEKQRKFLKTKYQMLLPSELLKKTKKTNTVIIDVRTITEFNSTDTIAWKNVGRLKNAINIPLSTISKTAIEPFKDKKIVIYDIMMHDELYEFAKQMKSYGIKDFYMLIGGITQVKWEIYNLEKKELKALLDE